jgi:hypothetical protein
MLRSDFGLDPRVTVSDFQLAYDGKVSPLLLWHKHPVALVALALSALAALLMLKRMVFGRRRRP